MSNGAQHCPECGSKMSIKDTGHGGGMTFRVAECLCGIRIETQESQIRRLPARMPGMAPTGNRPPEKTGNVQGPATEQADRERGQARGVSGSSGSLFPEPDLGSPGDPKRARVSAEERLAPVIAALDGHDFADARDMHDAVEDALYAAGFECKREFEVQLSTERVGFIDLVAWQPGQQKIGLELDMLTPRRKSIRKLFRLPDAIRVVLLRTAAKGRVQTSSSLDLVYGLGCTARDSYPEEFMRLWGVYPRKDGKGAAFRAWKAQRPPEAAVVAALGWQRKSDQWTKDGGRFIPHLATYLNGRRWQDEPTVLRIVAGPRVPVDDGRARATDRKVAELRAAAARAATPEELAALKRGTG